NAYVANDANGNGVIDPGEFDRQVTEPVKNASGKLRYDRFLDDKDSVYVTLRAGFDQPAGKEFVAAGQVGYSRVVYKDDQNELDAELGYDFSHESYYATGVDSISIHSLRAFLGFTSKLTPTSGFGASAELYSNLNKETVPQGEASVFEDTRGTF